MRRLISALALVLALVGCGNALERFPPTPADLQSKGQWFTLVKPDGTPIECFLYAKGEGYRSWLAFDCPSSVRAVK